MSYSILDSIGNTPIVEIKKINTLLNVKIFAKLEYLNPGGSIKDRPALFMIEQGEKTGELSFNKTVIEATSGNTGIGLAMVCSVKGYNLVLVMSESASKERRKILEARGAKIILTPGHLGTDGAIEEAYNLARENPDTYFITDQFNNSANWKSHYHTTAIEILKQTKGKVDAIVATLGTSGTIMGISKKIKEINPSIKIIGVEPYLGHKIQGLKNMKEAYTPEIFDKKQLDEKINIDDELAFKTARLLAKKEGLFVGMSSGAAMAVALQQAKSMKKGTIVVIFPDGGERYLSTPLFTVKDNITLNLFNSLLRKKQVFKPTKQGRVSIYTCGHTVNKRMDPGQIRKFLCTDLLCRYLEFRNLTVNHIVNITDLDDKTIYESEKAGESLSYFTQRFINAFKEDLKKMKIRPAQGYPLVSEHVDDMTLVTEKLVQKGSAYEKLNSVYFNISSLSDYGVLSGVNLDKIRLGATVDLDDYEKDNPRDFTLLKRVKLSELKRGVCVKTKWGNVRPSLHLQCAAIAMKYLGQGFDIHTGTRELIFPHHENEIAISKAVTGISLAKFWMHCEKVHYDGSLGVDKLEDINISMLEKMGWEPQVVRFWLISGHYSKTLLLSQQALENAKDSLNKINRCLYNLTKIKQGKSFKELDQFLYDIRHGFLLAMDDDFKVTDVIAVLFKSVKKLNKLMNENKIDSKGANLVIALFKDINSVLKIFDFSSKKDLSVKIKELLKKREQARLENNWELADKLRQELITRNVEIHDKKVK